jgi:putative transposase
LKTIFCPICPGCQFASEAFTSVLKIWNVRVSMDGKGRFKDNIFIERLWRTLKHERIYLKYYETGVELSRDLKVMYHRQSRWLEF